MHTAKPDSPRKKRTAPQGVLKHRPIALRLLPAEFIAVEAAAEEQNCSLNALARSLVIKGLPSLKKGIA